MADHAEGHDTVPRSRLTRRRVVAQVAAATAAGALSTARRALAQSGQVQNEPDVRAAAVPAPVPAADPTSPLWERIRAVEIALVGQAVAIPTKMTPSVPSLAVQALHDGKIIAFRLQWKDARRDTLSVKTTQFRDSCAVFLGRHPAAGDLWFMGAADRPVTLLHWRADWQLDIEAGFQDLEAAFPNVAFDFYPPLAGAKHPPKLPDAYPPGTRTWLPGWRVGNPLSQPLKATPVEKLSARGPGTVTSFANQDALGRGVWRDGVWTVVLAKSLRATDEREILLKPGGRYALAFAVWSGAHGDVGARKSITRLGRLHLEGG